MDKQRLTQLLTRIGLLLLFITAIAAAAFKYSADILYMAANPDVFKDMLSSYGASGIIIFIGVQIVQVIIAALPGDLTQIAGGYIYGTLFGSLYSMIGITLGSVIVFYASRLLGYSLINLFVPKELLKKFSFLINNPKSEIAMFILFLIPGLPKDTLSYLAGITPVKPMTFFMISSAARIPALVASTYIGANLQQGNYTVVAIVSVISCILIITGFLKKDLLIAFLHSTLHKKKDNLKVDSELIK
ncbi:MAG TPA: TVP38/TMEM64 family protein [Clostridia bacterium]|nr:TVP38/TMEM64 family protein [Clostridia bacterium]